MRRVGPKGSGQFEPVSWDEALSDIAANLRHGDFLPGGSFYEEAQKDAWPAVVGVRPR